MEKNFKINVFELSGTQKGKCSLLSTLTVSAYNVNRAFDKARYMLKQTYGRKLRSVNIGVANEIIAVVDLRIG